MKKRSVFPLVAFFSIVFLFGASQRSIFASVRLPRVFGDATVLQRDAKTPIWGWGEVGEKVVVEIAGQRKSTAVDESGKWRVELTPREAGGPFELKILATNTIIFKDVYFGDVWLCAGQSNMSFPLKQAENGAQAVASATYPRLRLLTIPPKTSDAPLDDFDASWKICSPETVADFSAVAYFFGRRLHEELQVAIGLIDASWGGSTAEAWVDPKLLAKFPELAPIVESERLANSVQHQRAGSLRNGMLLPLRPFAIKGVVWYQGESNASRAWQYRLLFPILISNWREDWGQGDFPFYFVQLANFMPTRPKPTSSAWAELRESQHKTTSAVRNVGEAIAIDLGDANDIHPKNKEAVGDRLALLALAKNFERDVVCAGPEFRSMRIADNRAILTFTNVGAGLKIGENAQCDALELRGFAVAGADRKFYWATATLDGETVVVSASEVSKPVAVRYAWADNPVCNLVNADDLPASPFRTDDWPGVTVENR